PPPSYRPPNPPCANPATSRTPLTATGNDPQPPPAPPVRPPKRQARSRPTAACPASSGGQAKAQAGRGVAGAGIGLATADGVGADGDVRGGRGGTGSSEQGVGRTCGTTGRFHRNSGPERPGRCCAAMRRLR